MIKLREITKKTYDNWSYYDDYDDEWPFYWVGIAHYGWPDRRGCVHKIITGHKLGIHRNYHAMKVNCECQENNTATVVCLAKLDGPNGIKFVKCFHKPGQCPHLTYEALPKTGEADDAA